MKLAIRRGNPANHLPKRHPKSLTYGIQLGFSFLLFKVAVRINTVLVTSQMTPGLSNMVGRHMKKRLLDPQQQADPIPKVLLWPGFSLPWFSTGKLTWKLLFLEKGVFKVDLIQTEQIINFSSSHKIKTVAGSKPRTPGLNWINSVFHPCAGPFQTITFSKADLPGENISAHWRKIAESGLWHAN